MQFAVENLAGLQRRLTISIPSQDILGEIDQRIKQLAKTATIAGFRTGKAPSNLIKKRFFDQVREEAFQELLATNLKQALTESNLHSANTPKLTSITGEQLNDAEVQCTFTLELFPKVDLIPLNTLEFEKPDVVINENDLDKVLKIIHFQHATWNIITDRAAQWNDLITIDFTGKLENGAENFPGSSGTNIDLILGKNTVFQEFEQHLIGKYVGELQPFELTFPTDYSETELVGQKATFQVTLKNIQSLILPEINSEFIQQFGIADGTIESFRQQIRTTTERDLKNKLWQMTKAKVLHELYQRHPLELPQCLIEEALTGLRAESSKDNVVRNEEELLNEAHRRVALGIIISEIAQINNIKPGVRRLREYIRNLANDYEDPDYLEKAWLSNAERLKEIQMIVFEDMVVELVLTQAKITTKIIPFSDFLSL